MRFNRIVFLLLAVLLFLGGCQRAHAEAAHAGCFVDELTFLGDSITAHMAQRADVSPTRVWSTRARYLNLDARIAHARIVAPDTGEEELIATVAGRIRPAYLVITLGIDYGVYYYRDAPETFARCYEILLDRISDASPDTVLLLQSIFPVTAACRVVSNEMIDRANAVIRDLAARRGLYYLDTQTVLRDAKGYLDERYCSSADGIHLNAAAYEAILSYIESCAADVRGVK